MPERFQKMYLREYRGPILDWPSYKRLEESPEEIAELRAGYAALTTMCDSYFGRLLDLFDAHDLWQDTDLILTTDHGFLMGEHDCQAKNRMPVYDEIARFPFIMHPPGVADQSGTRRNALTQTMDLMSTLLG
ncbi:MAG: sulfatase-like hydrolase/transferase [Pseudomonadota bacterium]